MRCAWASRPSGPRACSVCTPGGSGGPGSEPVTHSCAPPSSASTRTRVPRGSSARKGAADGAPSVQATTVGGSRRSASSASRAARAAETASGVLASTPRAARAATTAVSAAGTVRPGDGE
ncbi:hypothetical protein SALBM135S_09914 [Streptomyces alboniger]